MFFCQNLSVFHKSAHAIPGQRRLFHNVPNLPPHCRNADYGYASSIRCTEQLVDLQVSEMFGMDTILLEKVDFIYVHTPLGPLGGSVVREGKKKIEVGTDTFPRARVRTCSSWICDACCTVRVSLGRVFQCSPLH